MIRLFIRAITMLVKELQRGNPYATTGVAVFAGVVAASWVVSRIKCAHAAQNEEFEAGTPPLPPADRFDLP